MRRNLVDRLFRTPARRQVYFYQAMTGWLTRRKMDFEAIGALHDDIDSAYTYSGSGRLETAGGVSYTFNGGGALTKVAGSSSTATLTYSQRQKVTARKLDGDTEATYQWDNANDRRVSEKDADGTVTRSYAYGADGMLSHLDLVKDETTLDFTYGADGQRLKMVFTDATSTTTTTTYTYDGLSLLALAGVNGDQSWSISYLYNASGDPYAGYYEDLTDSGSGSRSAWFAIVTDLRGDVVELLDENGDPFASYRYSVWGKPQGGSNGNGILSRSTTAIADADLAGDIAARQVLRYCGYVYDAASELYYCSARYYDYETRQFTSRDPAAADGAESAYQYASGAPTLASDPSGERPIIGDGYYARYNHKSKSWDAVPTGSDRPWTPPAAYARMHAGGLPTVPKPSTLADAGSKGKYGSGSGGRVGKAGAPGGGAQLSPVWTDPGAWWDSLLGVDDWYDEHPTADRGVGWFLAGADAALTAMTAKPSPAVAAQLDLRLSAAGNRIGNWLGGRLAGASGRAGADLGLAGRGFRPAPGTRVRPKGIPENWRITGTDAKGGTQYFDPSNRGNAVRVMQGNPNSRFPNSQAPYVAWQKNGARLDMFGNVASKYDPLAHIPLQDFKFLPELFR